MLEKLPDRDRSSYEPPAYPADRLLAGIVVGLIFVAALIGWVLVGR
jgi:hypothetical protein